MPETRQSSREIAVEAIADLARSFALRMAIAVVLWLATLQIFSWFPSLPERWHVGLSTGIAVLGASLVAFLWDRRRRA
jgi:hypothetical protein